MKAKKEEEEEVMRDGGRKLEEWEKRASVDMQERALMRRYIKTCLQQLEEFDK
jgi:hypothetical protein